MRVQCPYELFGRGDENVEEKTKSRHMTVDWGGKTIRRLVNVSYNPHYNKEDENSCMRENRQLLRRYLRTVPKKYKECKKGVGWFAITCNGSPPQTAGVEGIGGGVVKLKLLRLAGQVVGGGITRQKGKKHNLVNAKKGKGLWKLVAKMQKGLNERTAENERHLLEVTAGSPATD